MDVLDQGYSAPGDETKSLKISSNGAEGLRFADGVAGGRTRASPLRFVL